MFLVIIADVKPLRLKTLSQAKGFVFNATSLKATRVSVFISAHKRTTCLPSQALGYTSEFVCQHSEIVKVEQLRYSREKIYMSTESTFSSQTQLVTHWLDHHAMYTCLYSPGKQTVNREESNNVPAFKTRTAQNELIDDHSPITTENTVTAAAGRGGKGACGLARLS